MVVLSTSGSLAMVARARKAFSSDCEKAPVVSVTRRCTSEATLIQGVGVVPVARLDAARTRHAVEWAVAWVAARLNAKGDLAEQLLGVAECDE
eukprot:2487472-Prymnesium_polylepis.1